MSDINSDIEDFISGVFTPEYIANIRQAFSLFEAFEHQNAYNGMLDAINNESISDVHGRSDHFTVELTNQLDFIIKEHLIILTDEATIKDRITILDALYRLQHLEDYTEIVSILSTEEDAVDKMSLIMEVLTTENQGYFLSLFKEVDDRTLKLLDVFIQGKTDDQAVVPIDRTIIKRIQEFNQTFGEHSIGYVLLDAGMTAGYPVDLYLPFVAEALVVRDDIDQTAKNILSILYMSDTPEQDFISKYRAIAETVIGNTVKEQQKAEQPVMDPNFAAKVEGSILKCIAMIGDIRKMNHEKAGLLKESAASKPTE